MATSSILSVVPLFCGAISSMSKSWRTQFWFLVTSIGWVGWLVVGAGIVVWTEIEIIGGFGTSSNGFSWRFNVMIGSVTFTIFQAIIAFILSTIFGDGIYCLGWPLALHLLPFGLTGVFLRWINVWDH
jgi:hypothetical protein